VTAADGTPVEVTRALPTVHSVLYDAVLVPGGAESVRTLSGDGKAVHFVAEAYKHYKAIGALGEGSELLSARVPSGGDGPGVIIADDTDEGFITAFAEAVAAHRHFGRETAGVPA
jgi:catalase